MRSLDTLKAFDDLETSKKSIWSNVFWYIKVCIFWYSIHYKIEVKQNKKKLRRIKIIPFGQHKRYKKCPLFFSRAPTYQRFTFNSQFLYDLKHNVRLSKTVCGIFHFPFGFVFMKVYIFVRQNVWTLWLQNVMTPFKIKIIEKLHTALLPNVWFLSCNKNF